MSQQGKVSVQVDSQEALDELDRQHGLHPELELETPLPSPYLAKLKHNGVTWEWGILVGDSRLASGAAKEKIVAFSAMRAALGELGQLNGRDLRGRKVKRSCALCGDGPAQTIE